MLIPELRERDALNTLTKNLAAPPQPAGTVRYSV